MSPEKKPPARVLSMNGEEIAPDVITREDFIEADEAQQAVLLAQGEERKVLGRLRVRIERGANTADCEYYLDKRLGIVRHKRIEPGSAGPVQAGEREVGS